MSIRQVSAKVWRPTTGWRLLQVVTVAALALAAWRYLWLAPYRIDIDVYRMGGRAWLDSTPLYSDGTLFTTKVGLGLPFTYPPLAAVVFAPFAWLSMAAASATITVITFALLVTSTFIVLTRLGVWERSTSIKGAAWLRRGWLAAAIVAPALLALEPIRSNFDFGQINVIVMTLVIADCVPRRTPWPRGLLLGLAIALKLTPAVFLLYFLLRRDTRALLTTAASLIVATAVGFALAWVDSWEYWTTTIRDTDRIGGAAYRTNQNIAGTLARLSLDETPRFVIWVVVSFGVLALTVWAVRRLLRNHQDVLALICVAMFGLVVSPVSWSHHWVWCLPAILVTTVIGYRYRNVPLAAVSAVGVALMVAAPFNLMQAGDGKELSAPLWRQLIGCSYLWWALALIVVSGAVSLRSRDDVGSLDTTPAHASVSRQPW